MPPPAQAPTLPDELLEEIFLRLPPDEPECLVRASAASKLWLGRLAAPRFHGRYREFHGAPPMLGFFHSNPYFIWDEEPLFVSTTKFRVCRNKGYAAFIARDCRHGRVLLEDIYGPPMKLVLLDPMTGCRRALYAPGRYSRYGAGVLCAVDGCDHGVCHGGLSRVVFVGLQTDDDAGFVAHGYVSSPHKVEWSKASSGLDLGSYASIQRTPPVLIKEALYFRLAYDEDGHVGILKYDLSSQFLSLIDVPLVEKHIGHATILMGMEDGSLGFAHLDGLTLNMWSRQLGSDGVGSWTECRVIDLKELLPVPTLRLRPIGSVEGRDIIFVTTDIGVYKVNLKSLEWKQIWKEQKFPTLFPYMSFYYPRERTNPSDAAH